MQMFPISFDEIIDIDFANLALLMQATGQSYLRPSAETLEAVNFSLLLHTIRSMDVDFEGSFKLGLVGSSMSRARLRFVTYCKKKGEWLPVLMVSPDASSGPVLIS